MNNQTFPSVKQPPSQAFSQALSQAETQVKPAGAVRWLLSFSFFLVLFATLALLISYGVIRLRSAEKPTAAATVAAPATSGPAPTNSPNAPAAAETLPSGTAGHAGNSTGSQK